MLQTVLEVSVILSHRHRFIFIKTAKTAGTSLEVFLASLCGAGDVVTPISPPLEGHLPRNYRGVWNPVAELGEGGVAALAALKNLIKLRRYHSHMAAATVKCRVPESIWRGYFKFCVERNPWDKTLSHYWMAHARAGGRLTLDSYLARGDFPVNYRRYTDSTGELLVDRVLRYERLDEELGELFRQLGLPFAGSLQVRAKSGYRKDRRPYREVFDDRQRKLVECAFVREIEMHGYRF